MNLWVQEWRLFSRQRLAMIALALVWPQGLGARSPGPFGHQPAKPSTAKGPVEAPSLLPGLPAVPSASQ